MQVPPGGLVALTPPSQQNGRPDFVPGAVYLSSDTIRSLSTGRLSNVFTQVVTLGPRWLP